MNCFQFINVINFILVFHLILTHNLVDFWQFSKKSYIRPNGTKEVKLEIVKTYWICGGSVTSARRLLQRRDMSKFGRLHTTTTVRIVKKLETDCSLSKMVELEDQNQLCLKKMLCG